MAKSDALEKLRDALAALNYELMENYGTRLRRANLGSSYRLDYMEERKNGYLQVKWSRDVWDEELTSYYSKILPPLPKEVRASFPKARVTARNARILIPLLKCIEDDTKHDFKRYMHENWNK